MEATEVHAGHELAHQTQLKMENLLILCLFPSVDTDFDDFVAFSFVYLWGLARIATTRTVNTG